MSGRTGDNFADFLLGQTYQAEAAVSIANAKFVSTGFALYAEQAGVQSGWYSAFGWVFQVLGESMTVRLWHHVAVWIVIIFSMVHMYMAIREDMTHRQTTISSMISGWRFFR